MDTTKQDMRTRCDELFKMIEDRAQRDAEENKKLKEEIKNLKNNEKLREEKLQEITLENKKNSNEFQMEVIKAYESMTGVPHCDIISHADPDDDTKMTFKECEEYEEEINGLQEEIEDENGMSKLVHHQNMGLLEDLKKLKDEMATMYHIIMNDGDQYEISKDQSLLDMVQQNIGLMLEKFKDMGEVIKKLKEKLVEMKAQKEAIVFHNKMKTEIIEEHEEKVEELEEEIKKLKEERDEYLIEMEQLKKMMNGEKMPKWNQDTSEEE
jgi:hypothetical protein